MQSKTRLVQLATRVQQTVACRVAKTLQQGWETATLTQLHCILLQQQDLFTGNTWLLSVSDAINTPLDTGLLLQGGPDHPAPDYVVVPHWQLMLVEMITDCQPARHNLRSKKCSSMR